MSEHRAVAVLVGSLPKGMIAAGIGADADAP
jgi:hypothetical protein